MRRFRTSRRRVRDAVTRPATRKCFSYRGPRRTGSSEPSVTRSHLVEHAPDQHPQRLAVAAGIVALTFDIAWARRPRGAGGVRSLHRLAIDVRFWLKHPCAQLVLGCGNAAAFD